MTIGITGMVGVTDTATDTIIDLPPPNTRCLTHSTSGSCKASCTLKEVGSSMRVGTLQKLSLAAVVWFILFLATQAAIQEVVWPRERRIAAMMEGIGRLTSRLLCR